ncbi:two-partner secretion domain-containing protein [Anabaenopsis elenkinii]|nr:filamentous hemagglutinin N-terminal domain-containing protein [Anabaenopsis elenkinii]
MIDGFIKHPSCKLFLQIFIGLITTANMQVVNAQLTPDNSLNSTVRNDTVNNRDIIEGGAIRGSNLFHSFTDFNVGADRGVYFSNPDSIGNIFTRVTGTNPSSILGTLGVLGNANLFLINPHGISFGDNARLDVKGSFIAASADSTIFDNYEFSSTDTTAQPLLTVNIPRGLRFRDDPGNITLTNSSLSVPEGKTLALIGGNVSLNNTQIRSPGSTVQLGGLTQSGRVDIDDNLGLSFPRPLDSAATNITKGNVSLSNGAAVNVAAGGGGSITINSQNLEITGNSQLLVGIAPGMGSPDAQGGDIQINNADKITLDNSFILNGVFGQGNGGNIHINTSSLTLKDFGLFFAGIFGKGNAGAITITATDGVTLTGENSHGFSSYITSTVLPTGEGNSGGITIDTSTLTLENGANINTSTSGKGNAGAINITATEGVTLRGESSQGFSNSYIASAVAPTAQGNSGDITIDTSTLTLENGGTINASTFGQGNAGSIVIRAADGVTIRGESSRGLTSSVSSAVAQTAQGNSVGITIDTSTLTLENGGIINASTFGKGNAGAINIRATEQVGISGTYFNPALNRDVGGIVAFTLTDNNAGNITINTPRFQISDGAGVEAFTQGAGNAGNVTITAPQIVDIGDNSKIIVETSSAGRPGNININTDTLNIGKDAQLSATATATATNTQGGGSITLNSSNLTISGKLGIFAQTQGQAPAGNLTLQPYNNHPNLNINFTDKGFISASTTARGAGGNISLTAPQQMNIQGNGKISVETSGSGNAGQIDIKTPNLNLAQGVEITASTSQQGNAGNIQLYITDNLRLNNSSISSSTTPDSTGRGGNIIIDPILIELNSGSTIAVNSAGAGDGGNIFLTGENLNLSQGSTITANTASGEGGNITLNITDTIRQRDRSNISATAGGSGNGGNITVNTSFLLSRDSNITADAFAGRGGNINITAQRIFQDRDSKITASSQLGIDGVIETNTPEVDPIQGLIEFPEDVLDPNALIAQNACRQWGKSEFTVRGKGGLPGSPEQIHSSHEVGVSLIAPTTEESSAVVTPVSIMTRRVIPAQGWVVNAQGDVVLVAAPRGNNPQRVPVATTCN